MPIDSQAAIQHILDRIDETLAAADEGFPQTAPPGDPQWKRAEDGSWNGGMWVGMLWLAALLEPERYRETAGRWCRRLAPRADSDTVFRGFLFWYGAALGERLLEDAAAGQQARAGAISLAASHDSRTAVLPVGAYGEWSSGEKAGEGWIDGVPGSVPLLGWAGREEVGLEYARRLAELCVDDAGSVAQAVGFDPESAAPLKPHSDNAASGEGVWSRAQAWAMLGFAQAAAISPEFLPTAKLVADRWLAQSPDGEAAPWDFSWPEGEATYRDTSATAIAAAALLKLARVAAAEQDTYTAAARRICERLLAERMGDREHPGRLLDGCYNGRRGIAVDHELVWGTYFLLEALLVLDGRLDALSV